MIRQRLPSCSLLFDGSSNMCDFVIFNSILGKMTFDEHILALIGSN